MNRAVRLSTFAQFEGEFGGVAVECPLSDAVLDFFQNGGQDARVVRVAGVGGAAPGAADFCGDAKSGTGFHALEPAETLNWLCVPDVEDSTVLLNALSVCQARRALLLIDLPVSIRTSAQARAWLEANPGLRSRDAAAWFPRYLRDDQGIGAVRARPSSGAVAGIHARNDAVQGVWKSPPVSDAAIRDATGSEIALTEMEARSLQSAGLNSLRTFPARGTVLWGARTLGGADASGDEFKYVPVRRLALFLEESIFRGTSWVVFEPNDEPLWKKVRASVEAFLHGLFVKAAFQGATPRQAYFVKCGRDTMTQTDIDNGRLIIEIGIAPVKPAEFVIIRIGQFGCRGGDC